MTVATENQDRTVNVSGPEQAAQKVHVASFQKETQENPNLRQFLE